MRDGVKLFTSIYIPKDSSEKPPHSNDPHTLFCAPYGETNLTATLWGRHWGYYARENYNHRHTRTFAAAG